MPAIGSDADLGGPDANTTDDDLPTFGPQPFLDHNFVNGSAMPTGGLTVPSTLLSAATDLYFLQDIRLKGIHSLMFVDEVALIGVPHATQRGWAPGPYDLVSPPPGAAGAPATHAVFADCLVPPVLLSVDPAFGPVAGGTSVRLTGSGFPSLSTDTVSVTFGGRAAALVEVSNGSTLTCRTPPAAAPGPAAVAVADSAGTTSL